MKNIGTIIAAIVLAVVLLAYMCTFQVRFTEVAIEKTWGQPDKEALTEPGLYFKWPKPIQTTVVYDKRARILEDRTEETRTIDGKNLLVTTFTLWRIKDPYKFHTNFPAGVEDGERKLRTTIITHKHAVIGKREFKDFVSTDPADRKIRDVEKELLAVVAKDAEQQFGVEVVDFGIKKLGLPTSVTTAIFESMKSYEEQKAKRYIAEGEAKAADIVANAKAVEERILAEARKKAAEIQTDAQRVVSEYYKEFSEYPELRIFLDKLRTIREALQQRTTLILTTEQPPWDVFDAAVRENIPAAAGGERAEVGGRPGGTGESTPKSE
jgi:membrane protease subunit HflC